MSLYSGVTGKISIKQGENEAIDIVHMANWNLELSKEILEVLSFGDEYKEKVPSVKDWSASFDGTADFDSESGQKTLLDAFESGDTLVGSFYLDSDTFFQGECLVESLSIDDAADGKADISISLAGSKAVKLTVPEKTTT